MKISLKTSRKKRLNVNEISGKSFHRCSYADAIKDNTSIPDVVSGKGLRDGSVFQPTVYEPPPPAGIWPYASIQLAHFTSIPHCCLCV